MRKVVIAFVVLAAACSASSEAPNDGAGGASTTPVMTSTTPHGKSDASLPDASTSVEADTGAPQPTLGGGTKASPAEGPAPSLAVDSAGYVLVKNWDFGRNGTIKSIDDLSANFQYHDQFGQISNGGGLYGSLIVSPDAQHAIAGQPVEDPAHPVREILDESMKTYLVGLDAGPNAVPSQHNTGSGSFQSSWTLPNAGALLGEDLLWETRVRYVTPRYFWFAIWVAGNMWNPGAEFDLIESFGFDNGGGNTNYDGRLWHSNSIAGADKVDYASWSSGMSNSGFATFDAAQWHTWQMVYRKDDTYTFYCDGKVVQNGSNYPWTVGAVAGHQAINMSFIFDGAWAHTQIASVNHDVPFTEFQGKYYEWDYSRVYLR